ncbi:MAG: SIMPL domain-containing protein [Desulfurococcales archaeon]|nr:SIMPL domain-containing protein [Desulfurococcales archaeon]
MNLSKVLVIALIAVVGIAAATSATALGLLLSDMSGGGGQAVSNGVILTDYRDYAVSGAQGYVLRNAVITSATATVYVVPSRIIVSLTLETPVPYKNASKAYEDVATRANELVSRLKSIEGVIYIQTLSVRLSPQYEWTKEGRVFKGYVASYALITEVELSAAGKVIAEAVKVSTDSIKGISFTVPKEELEKAREEALRAAVRKVHGKAQAVAEELNITLGKVIYLTTGYSTPEYTLRYVKELSYSVEAGGLPEVPIEVGKGFPVTATVNAAFEIVEG